MCEANHDNLPVKKAIFSTLNQLFKFISRTKKRAESK